MISKALKPIIGTGMSVVADGEVRISSRRTTKALSDKFTSLVSDKFTAPKVFAHDVQLSNYATFVEGRPEIICNGRLRDDNFAAVTQQFVPGSTYGIEIFAIAPSASSEECLKFLASQEAMFVGAQGITLIQQVKPEIFPSGKWTASLDKKKALWKDISGVHRVMGIQRFSDGIWRVFFNNWSHCWTPSDCLLCVHDLSS